MKITKYFLVATAASMAGALMSNVPSHKKDVYHASILDPNVAQLMAEFQNKQGLTYQNNFASFYFSNLRENINFNVHGTCGFVSLGMVLSYYDTYLDDRFVPEQFEQNTFIEPSAEGAIIGKGTESPGVVSEDFNLLNSMENYDYEDYVIDNPNASFQNFLMNYAADNDNGFCWDRVSGSSAQVGLGTQEQADLLDSYLEDFVGLEDVVRVVEKGYKTTSQMKNEIRLLLNQGRPVIVNLTSADIGKHSVVAYENNGPDIYVHTGWKDANGNALTHVKLDDLDRYNFYSYSGMSIDSYVSLDLSGFETVEEPDNYVTVDANDNIVPVSLKTLAVPFDIRLEFDNDNPEAAPRLVWNSLYNERWFNNQNARFQAKIRDAQTNDIIQGGSASSNTYLELNANTVSRIYNEYGILDCVVEIKTILNEPVFGNKKVFNQTTRIGNRAEFEKITPSDYNFPTRNNNYAADFVDVTTQDGFDFKVRKTRNVSMDASGRIVFKTNLDATSQAYVEYNFLKPVTEIRLAVSEFTGSNMQTASEYQLAKGSLYVQGFRNAQYYPDLDGVSQVERHRTNLLVGLEDEFHNDKAYITYQFENPVSRARIYTSAQPNSNTSLLPGRVSKAGVIHNFNMYLEDVYVKPVEGNYLPTNGYEFHMPESCDCNDYVYALSIDADVVGQTYEPGEYTHDEYYDYCGTPEYYDLDVITEMAEADAAPGGLTGAGYTFEEIDKDELADDGCYKIAVAIMAPIDNPNSTFYTDFRFLRQNSDGTWSFITFDPMHRLANRDAYGNLIYDPSNLTYVEGTTTYALRSPNEIRFFQVSRDKGTIDGVELPTYNPPYDPGYNPTHDFTWDREHYEIQPPFTPIFTGEY